MIDIFIFNIKPIQFNPNPDKPELNIDPPEAGRFVVSLRSVFSIKIDSIPLRAVGSTLRGVVTVPYGTESSRRLKYSILLWHESCANMI